MTDPNNIQDELRSLNSDLPVNNSPTPFSVPGGYFDGLAAQILAKAKAQEETAAAELQGLSPLLAGLSKSLPYTVPTGYFDETAAVLSSLAKEETLSPVLAAAGKEVPYTVPQGYFEQVPLQIMATLTRPKAEVVPFFSRTWAKAAVAAAIGGLVFLGGYRLLNSSAEPDSSVVTAQQSPADTAGNEIVRHNAGTAPDLKNITAEEAEAFIKTLPLNAGRTQRATLEPADKKEVAEWLKDVPQTEIEAFLEALPSADETLIVID